MFYTYIIQSIKNDRFYIGSREDLKNRFKEHNFGKVRSTKSLSRQAELFYKTSQGRRQLKKKLSLQ